jgi:hypothetical protein
MTRQGRRRENRLLTYLGIVGGEDCATVARRRFAVYQAVREVIWSSPGPEWEGL